MVELGLNGALVAAVHTSTRNYGRRSGCGSEWDRPDLGGWHSRIPGGEEVAQCAVDAAGSGFQGKVSLFLGPLHLLLCMKAPADDEADHDWFIRIPGAARVDWRMTITIRASGWGPPPSGGGGKPVAQRANTLEPL